MAALQSDLIDEIAKTLAKLINKEVDLPFADEEAEFEFFRSLVYAILNLLLSRLR